MDSLTDISAIREILNRHGFRFSKSLGQNFLINPAVCPRMARECGADGETGVIEVGPGIGVLTRELALRAKKVVAVELDRRLLPVLSETLDGFGNVSVISGDILKIDLNELVAREFPDGKAVLCANLPYYITSPVIMRFLEEHVPVSSLTVMVQKEAARRICAQPGNRECGAVSVAVRYYAEPEILFEVSRGSFLPAPKVDSTVIRLTLRRGPREEIEDEARFFALVKAAFAQRRKTLQNAVSSGLGIPKAEAARALSRAGIEQNARAEQLTMEQFAALSNSLPE